MSGRTPQSAALPVLVDVPDQFAPRATWVLQTLFAAGGTRLRVERDPSRATECALAYAAVPLADVPTLGLSVAALELFDKQAPLPRDSFAAHETGAGRLVGAFPCPDERFVAPFDVVASAFVLLACWDELTRTQRDLHGRLPYANSTFATNAALQIERPAVDGYARLVEAAAGERLAALGLPPLSRPDWRAEGENTPARFAVALTHDLDNLWRWTSGGLRASARRSARGLRQRRFEPLAEEARDVYNWLTRHLPQGTDPYWTFPQIIGGEDERGVSSTFFALASHSRRDFTQPLAYRRRLPAALHLLTQSGREVGLHGSDRDRTSLANLEEDRQSLAQRAGVPVGGMRYHYLRCLYHETLPLLDEAGFDYDSSMAFAEREGCRCGFSFPFHPYDTQHEKPLRLVELPLLLMDTGLADPQYRGLDANEAWQAGIDVLQRVRDSGGAAAILWHNSRFDPSASHGYDKVYWDLLQWTRAEYGFAGPAGEVVRRWRKRSGEGELAS